MRIERGRRPPLLAIFHAKDAKNAEDAKGRGIAYAERGGHKEI